MKRILFASLMALALSCTREAPKPTAPFLLVFRMPEACKAEARYKNQRVVFKGNLSYQFETDIAGMVTVDGMVPGIYDIITNWEMSGKEYKALLKDPTAAVEDKARVIVGVSLMNQRLFDARDMVIDLSAAVVKGLMISKVYYAGTKDKMGRNYGTDSYVEIFNNSDEVLYIDGKYLGLAEAVSPAAYPAHENPDSIYMRQICKFPGNGSEYPVQPGGSVVVAAKSATVSWKSKVVKMDWFNGGSSVLATGSYGYIYDINTMPHGDQTIAGNNYEGQFCLHMTGSTTHGTTTVNVNHQAAINQAYNWAH